MLSGEKVCVTRLAASPDKRHIAVGYTDGTVKTFDLSNGENVSIFVGHKSEITALAYDALGHKLATGSKVRILYKYSYILQNYKYLHFFFYIIGYRYYCLGCRGGNWNMSVKWTQRCYN